MSRLNFAFFAVFLLAAAPSHAQTPPAEGRIVRPNAVIHSVVDIEASAAFYRDVLGLLPDASATAVVVPGAGPRRTTMLRVPGGDVKLVLVQFSAAGAKPVHPRLQDPGNLKLVMRVRDMDAAFERVRSKVAGVLTEGGAPIHPEGPTGFNRAVIMRDPDGFPLEFAYQQGPIAADVPATSMIIGGWATFIVEDAAATLAFYRDRLGFQPAGNGTPGPLADGVLSLQGTPSAKGSMSVGVKPPGAAATWRIYDYRNIERTRLPGQLKDPGTVALSFYAENVPALLARLKASGVTVEGTAFRDPNGLLVQLLEAR